MGIMIAYMFAEVMAIIAGLIVLMVYFESRRKR